MKILVYGAGNIGSLYAAKLKHGGHDVTILARGQRLREIRENGIRLQDSISGEETNTRVEAVQVLAADDAYELVLVILPRQRVNEVLPTLAENRNSPNILFFMNNAAGPSELIESLGTGASSARFSGGRWHSPRESHPLSRPRPARATNDDWRGRWCRIETHQSDRRCLEAGQLPGFDLPEYGCMAEDSCCRNRPDCGRAVHGETRHRPTEGQPQSPRPDDSSNSRRISRSLRARHSNHAVNPQSLPMDS